MKLKPVFNILGYSLIAIAMTAGAYLLDHQRAGIYQTMAALQLARQVASQAEGMAISARNDEHADPIGWAVNYLAQGVEPRIMRVTKMMAGESSAPEAYQLKPKSGTFEYAKVLTPEDGAGVRVDVRVDYTGFLGTKSRLANDLSLAAFFLATWVLLTLVFRKSSQPLGVSRPPLSLTARATTFKASLTQLGVQIRELVREAQKLTITSVKSRQLVHTLRERLHTRLSDLHSAVEEIKLADSAASEAEVLALNLIIEANRLGESDGRFAALAENLHGLIQKVRKAEEKGSKALAQIEIQLEPIVTDVDVIFHSFADVFKASEAMTGHIRKTTESMLDQAKSLKALNAELSGEDQAVLSEPTLTLAKSKSA